MMITIMITITLTKNRRPYVYTAQYVLELKPNHSSCRPINRAIKSTTPILTVTVHKHRMCQFFFKEKSNELQSNLNLYTAAVAGGNQQCFYSLRSYQNYGCHLYIHRCLNTKQQFRNKHKLTIVLNYTLIYYLTTKLSAKSISTKPRLSCTGAAEEFD